MKPSAFLSIASAAILAGCAGRAPDPIQTVQAHDTVMNCTMIEAEIQSNNQQISHLSGEESAKVAQNVAAGVAGLLIWPVWFAMDFQDAAGKESTALASRNHYLAGVYRDKGCVEPGDPAWFPQS
jgi:hypothetical protein